MSRVRFLQDFQGKETREVFYRRGQEVSLDEGMVDRLLADRRVELVAGNRFDVEPQFEQAEEPPQPQRLETAKRSRGKRK